MVTRSHPCAEIYPTFLKEALGLCGPSCQVKMRAKGVEPGQDKSDCLYNDYKSG